MNTNAPTTDLVPEASLKHRWRVTAATVIRWRETSRDWPQPAAQIGKRRFYKPADIEHWEQRELRT
jgi:hypothetical protein